MDFTKLIKRLKASLSPSKLDAEIEAGIQTLQARVTELENVEFALRGMLRLAHGERDAALEKLREIEGQEPSAYEVSGPYDRQVFKDTGSANAYCGGLNKGFGSEAYLIKPLYLFARPVPAAAPTAQPEPTDTDILNFLDVKGVDWDGLSGYFHSAGSHSADSLRESALKAMAAAKGGVV